MRINPQMPKHKKHYQKDFLVLAVTYFGKLIKKIRPNFGLNNILFQFVKTFTFKYIDRSYGI